MPVTISQRRRPIQLTAVGQKPNVEKPLKNNELLTTAEAAHYTTLSKSTLENLRCKGDGPPFIKVGKRAIRYKKQDLDIYLNDRCYVSTSQYKGKI